MKTKKFICAALCVLLAISCVSCSNKSRATSDEIALELTEKLACDIPWVQYIKTSDEYSPGYISEESFAYLYLGRKEKCAEWDMIENMRIILGKRESVFEIHVIKAVNISDVPILEKLVRRRAELLEDHIKASGNSTASVTVCTKGAFVFLLATDQNDKLVKCIDKSL